MPFIFFNYYPIENISIADFGLLILALNGLRKGFVVRARDVALVCVLTLGFVLTGLVAIKHYYFDLSSYINNVIRIVFYACSFLIISSRIRSGHFRIIRSLQRSFYLLCFSVIFELLLQVFGVYYSYYIPFLSRNTGPQFEAFRPSAFFDEPSYLSIYLVLGYYVVAQFNERGLLWRFVVAITVLMSQSLSGLAGLAWVIYTDDGLWLKYKRVKSLAALPLILGMMLLSPVLVERLQKISLGIDGSATHRLAGSLEVSSELLQNHLLTGIGLGQFKSWLSTGDIQFTSHFFMKEIGTGSGINNALLLALGFSGIFGLFTYIWFSLKISTKTSYVILMLWLSFSWGFIFHPFLFLFYSLLYGLKHK